MFKNKFFHFIMTSIISFIEIINLKNSVYLKYYVRNQYKKIIFEINTVQFTICIFLSNGKYKSRKLEIIIKKKKIYENMLSQL